MKKYEITVGGTPYTIEMMKRGQIKINDAVYELKDLPQCKAIFMTLEYELPIPEGKVILTGGYSLGIVVDGVNQQTGKPYTPMGKMPAWGNAFVILDFILLFIGWLTLMGGALGGAALGGLIVVAALQTARAATATDKPPAVRVLLSLGVTVLVCVAFVLIWLLLNLLFALFLS